MVILGSVAGGYGDQKLGSHRIGLGVKEDEVTSSEERNSTDGLKHHFVTVVLKYVQRTLILEASEVKAKLELPIISELPRASVRPPMEIPYLSLFPAENVYESAAKLLFIAIKWARTIPSFLQVLTTHFDAHTF